MKTIKIKTIFKKQEAKNSILRTIKLEDQDSSQLVLIKYE